LVAQASRHLGYKAAQSLYYAIGTQAERIGLPLTHCVTINFAETGILPWEAPAQFGHLRRDRFNKWATRPRTGAGRAVPPTYAFIFENVRDKRAYDAMGPGLPHNVHVHWLVHIPPERSYDFRARVVEWVDELAGIYCPAGTVDMRPIDNMIGMRGYALKGTLAGWAGHFGARAEDQGVIEGGRRSGTSRNLGSTARRALDRAQGIRRRAA
jgi:hypothetical protein